LDGPLPKWCPAVALSHQDGRHSAVALLLKAALIQVSDYRLLGASGLCFNSVISDKLFESSESNNFRFLDISLMYMDLKFRTDVGFKSYVSLKCSIV
jgi:hypothetical protein